MGYGQQCLLYRESVSLDHRFPCTSKGIIKKMATEVSHFSDLIQSVTASCLLHPHPLPATLHADGVSDRHARTHSDDDNYKTEEEEDEEEEEEEGGQQRNWEGKGKNDRSELRTERVIEMEMLLGSVFEAVSAMKRAYASLQESHCPWDPDKLRERFRRSVGGGGRGRSKVASATMREVVPPYEAAMEELKRQVEAVGD